MTIKEIQKYKNILNTTNTANTTYQIEYCTPYGKPTKATYIHSDDFSIWVTSKDNTEEIPISWKWVYNIKKLED